MGLGDEFRTRVAGEPSHSYQKLCSDTSDSFSNATDDCQYNRRDKPYDWQHSTYSESQFGPRPGKKKDNYPNTDYAESLTHQESKTVRILGLEDNSLRGDDSRRASPSEDTATENGEGKQRGVRKVMRKVKGRLEWTVMGKEATGVLDQEFWRVREESENGRRERRRGGGQVAGR